MVKESCRKKLYWGVRCSLVIIFMYLEVYPVKGAGAGTKTTACFISAIGRGVGTPLDSCRSGESKEGLVCYSPCKSGYKAAGPLCYGSCPPNYKDVGPLCIDTYRKSCCCTVFGCCGCRPGYKNNGCFCSKSVAKSAYSRGAGKPLTCGLGKEQSGTLCYKVCGSGLHGVGPICWGQHKPGQFPVNCNEVIWAADQATCNMVNADLANLGVSSAYCAGVVFAATAVPALWPLVSMVCNVPVSRAVSTVNDIINATHAKTCP